MIIKKNCKVCGIEFLAIKTNQYFCCRAHFKVDYNIRKREERKLDRETNPERFGAYICSTCGLRTPLPYSPKRYKTKFETFVCPGCGTPRFKDPKDMRIDWDLDIMRFNTGWKHPELQKGVTVSMTFQTFLAGEEPPTLL
jgi:hypothetical protein